MRLSALCLLLSALIGVSGSTYASSPNASAQTGVKPKSKGSRPTAFKLVQHLFGFGDAHEFEQYLYKSSDGVEVFLDVRGYVSPELAAAALTGEMGGTAKVIERGGKLDKGGSVVGERVVAMLRPEGSKKEVAIILWTNKSVFCLIQSKSVQHAIALEKDKRL